MNGVLTEYNLRFYDADHEKIVYNIRSNETLHIVQDTDIPTRRERTFVQVSMCTAYSNYHHTSKKRNPVLVAIKRNYVQCWFAHFNNVLNIVDNISCSRVNVIMFS